MARTKHVQIHLAVVPELADKFDVICAEWRLKRPWALERMVDREYKAIMKKRALAFPTLAQAEQAEDRARWIVDRFISTNEQPVSGEVEG